MGPRGMSLKRSLIRAYSGALRGAGGFLARRLKHNFYLYLAGVFSLIVVADVFVFHQIVDLRQKSYDFVIKNRIVKPKPSPDIVIVDIDEASLSALAKEYGRWPWPRQVLGEFVQQLEEQKPKAIVFDILFSDPDVYNQDSDTYFNDAIAETQNTFFPMLRLPPESDALSQVKPAMIPGVKPMMQPASPDVTVAVVLPFFKAALQGGRLGTHNIYPDNDGIVRSYRMFHYVGGWALPSLPLRVSEALGWKAPNVQDMLLNWRGPPFTYRYASFAAVYNDFLSQQRKRPADEFTDKIVLIGSTAPSLFDVKPTSMARVFPGVEVLATAIDNLQRDDYIRVPGSRIPVLLAALAILWATAWGFYRDNEPERFQRVFALSQIGLLAISYLTINLSNFFFNLTGPVTVGFIYFSIAKIYALATARALERNVVAQSLHANQATVGTVAVFQIAGPDDISIAVVMRALKKAVEKIGSRSKDVEFMRGKQRGILGLLQGTLVVTWLHSAEDVEQGKRVDQDVSALQAQIEGLVERLGINGEKLVAHTVVSAPLSAANAPPSPAQWRHLLGRALEQANSSGGVKQ
jgi:adenylate cyclase